MKLLVILCCAGCASFQAVEATAELGRRVCGFEHALDELPAWCRLSVAAGTQAEAECDRLQSDARLFAQIPVRLGAWSEALHRMASDGGATSIAPDVAALAHLELSSREAGGVGAALDALVRLATSGYRRKALAGALRQAAPQVALLIAYARGIVRVQRERVATLEEQARQVGRQIDPKTPAEIAARVALVDDQTSLARARATLDDYDRALAAFAAAHQRLAAGVDHPDAQLYGEILSDLKKVLGEVKP